MRPQVTVLGAAINPVTMAEAIEAFEQFIARRQPALAFSLNVDICMKLRRDPELRRIFAQTDLVLVDGTPMVWATRFLGVPLPGRVSGADFLPAFCRVAADRRYRLFLLGSLPGIAERAKQWLEAHNPGLQITGTYAPPFGFEQDDRESARIISIVKEASPDVLFVGLTSPKDQKWLFRYREALQVPISMGVGASFDYLAGRLRRAPQWMQRCGLEWTYRLAQEPHRLWRRYLVENPPFVYYVLRERLLSKPPSRPSPAGP